MNEKKAELVGMHVGDGTLYLSGKTIVWELRGSVEEKEYYEYIVDLIYDVFGVNLKPKFRGLNSYGIQTTNKIITKFFTDSGFKPGKKVHTVRIPDYIKSAEENIKKSFIKGLFDTDGCLRYEKNRTTIRYYPRLEFSSASLKLIDDLHKMLKDLKFRTHRWSDRHCERIGLAGFANLDKWMKEISPANPKHFNKYYNSVPISRGKNNKIIVDLP